MIRNNVVLITVDSLRADFVSCYPGALSDLTPNLDEFANRGVLFENALAQGPYTRASIPSLLTSTYPWKLPSGGNIGDRTTIATIFKDNGYNTAFFHSNPFLSKDSGYARGFDVFDDSLLPWNLSISQKHLKRVGRLFRLIRKTPYLPADNLVDKSISWLEDASEPFFLWVHLMDPHGPYQRHGGGYLAKYHAEKLWKKAVSRPEEITSEEHDELVRTYCEEISYTDEQVSRILDFLNTEENDLVVITADHGEEFGEHGDYSHNPKHFDELLRVPLMVNFPERRGDLITEQVALLDLLPSLVEHLDLDKNELDFDGRSFVPLLQGETQTGRKYVICQPGSDHICLRTKGWKYVVNKGEKSLYNLRKDPGENLDVAKSRPELTKKFNEVLLERRDEYGHSECFGEGCPSDFDEETRKRLEGLGYL